MNTSSGMNMKDRLQIMVVTVSDRASRGQYEDRSGPLVESLTCRYLHDRDFVVTCERKIVPDEREQIQQELRAAVDAGFDLVLTTGGTGIGPRDVTPEATLAVIAKELPGLTEAVRARFRDAHPAAMLSRAVAGVRGRTLLVNLPGSIRAVQEHLDVILPVVPHALEMIAGGHTHPD